MTLISLSILACGKKNTAAAENEGIVGKWKLTESLADPGDGSGKWQPADPAHPSYLEFRSDGTLISTPTGLPSNGADRYQLLSDSTVLFYNGTFSIRESYNLTKTTLSITPPCFEACGMHYIAVK